MSTDVHQDRFAGTSLRRVVLTIGTLHAGGTEGQLVQLAVGLRERGIDVAVAALFDQGVHARALIDAGIEVYFAQFPRVRHRPSSVWRLAPAFARYVRWLRAKRPQLVQMFLYHDYAITGPAARLAGARVLVAGRRSLSNFKQGRPLVLALERLVNVLMTHFVANCEAVAEDAIRTEGIPRKRMTIIPNGVPAEYLKPCTPLPIDSEWPLVACVANFRKCKGHRDLLAAMEVLYAQGMRFTLLLAGEGGLEDDLRHEARSRQLDVRFLGSIRHVPQLLAAANVVVLPSHAEGLSNSVLEAMAAGRAVVATSVGGTPELLGDCGLLVPPGQPVALAETIRRLIEDSSLGGELGRMARLRVESHFGLDSMIDRYVNLYEELIS